MKKLLLSTLLTICLCPLAHAGPEPEPLPTEQPDFPSASLFSISADAVLEYSDLTDASEFGAGLSVFAPVRSLGGELGFSYWSADVENSHNFSLAYRRDFPRTMLGDVPILNRLQPYMLAGSTFSDTANTNGFSADVGVGVRLLKLTRNLDTFADCRYRFDVSDTGRGDFSVARFGLSYNF